MENRHICTFAAPTAKPHTHIHPQQQTLGDIYTYTSIVWPYVLVRISHISGIIFIMEITNLHWKISGITIVVAASEWIFGILVYCISQLMESSSFVVVACVVIDETKQILLFSYIMYLLFGSSCLLQIWNACCLHIVSVPAQNGKKKNDIFVIYTLTMI